MADTHKQLIRQAIRRMEADNLDAINICIGEAGYYITNTLEEGEDAVLTIESKAMAFAGLKPSEIGRTDMDWIVDMYAWGLKDIEVEDRLRLD